MEDWRFEALIAVHELVEVLLCKHNNIPQSVVDEFDFEFEKNRTPGDESDPGDDARAPYRSEHCIATGVERILAAQFGVNWADYERMVNKL